MPPARRRTTDEGDVDASSQLQDEEHDVTVGLPDAGTRWRCAQCGNLTRFDVVRTSRVREFWHLDLAGEPVVEQADTVSETIESVACRWCGPGAAVEIVPRPDGETS